MTEVRTSDVDKDGFPVKEAAAPARAATPAPASSGSNHWLRWAWRQLTSMRIALILLFLLALGAIPGSMLPQQGSDPGGVQQYFRAHPSVAPLLNHLGLFNVFAAPWFAAIYLLLFTSLVGCVVPRTFRLAGSARTLPPRAPRQLNKLPHSAEYPVSLSPEQALEVSARVLSGHGFRLRRPGDLNAMTRQPSPGERDWLSAEKGYLREAGNLLFHLSLLGVLVSIAMGGLLGYKADRLLIAGQTFANTTTDLDEFYPGRLVSGSDLPPFSITLNRFNASYITSGPQLGQPAAFDAYVTYHAHPGDKAQNFDIQVNHPLNVDGAKVYLIGHGYAPVFKVTDASGHVEYDEATPFISGTAANFLSQGVVKVADAQPEGLGFTGVFVPTAAVDANGNLASVFPAPDRPVVSLIAYGGNLGMNNGASQSVYALDTTGMTQLTPKPVVLAQGQTLKLPGGKGSVTFAGYQLWGSFTITHDPGQLPALACGIGALAGLLLSFLVRRRRVFVRVRAAEPGSVVSLGGLARTDASGGFEAEFASLAAELRVAHEQSAPPEPAESQQESGD